MKEIVAFLIVDFSSFSIEKGFSVLLRVLKGLFKTASKCGNDSDKNQSHYVYEINHFKCPLLERINQIWSKLQVSHLRVLSREEPCHIHFYVPRSLSFLVSVSLSVTSLTSVSLETMFLICFPSEQSINYKIPFQ